MALRSITGIFIPIVALALIFTISCQECFSDENTPAGDDETEASLPSSVIIQKGDIISANLLEDDSFDFSNKVEASGTVTVPLLGSIEAVGRTTMELQETLTQKLLEQFYNKATLTVKVESPVGGQAFVYGAVKEPGPVMFSEENKMPISQAIAQVKGLTSWANPQTAYIVRHEKAGDIKIEVDLTQRNIRFSQESESSSYLFNGDELYIPGLNDDESQLLMNDEREVIVVGQVETPGIITFAPGEECTLMRAVFKAGGLTKFAKGSAVKLIRYRGSDRTVEEVDVDSIINDGFLDKDMELLAGDMLIVPQKLVNF